MCRRRASPRSKPITRSISLPLWKKISVGMPWMPSREAVIWLSSVLSFAKTILPSYSRESSSKTGAIIRQGRHHGAQKSTTTGLSDFKTDSPKLASLTCTNVSDMSFLLGLAQPSPRLLPYRGIVYSDSTRARRLSRRPRAPSLSSPGADARITASERFTNSLGPQDTFRMRRPYSRPAATGQGGDSYAARQWHHLYGSRGDHASQPGCGRAYAAVF